jgi:hypothetical protein
MKKSDNEFAQQTKELFDESVDGLDAATLSTLNQARQRALATITDMEILLGEDSIEMLEDLEFYSWIDMADEDDGVT